MKRLTLLAVTLLQVACGGGGGRAGDAVADASAETSLETSVDTTDAPSQFDDRDSASDPGVAAEAAAEVLEVVDGATDLADAEVSGSDVRADAEAIATGKSRVVQLAVAAQELVYDRTRNRIYASVRGDATTYANTVVAIDPTTDSVISSLAVGSDPGPLGLSDDDSTLWVGLTGARSIRKIVLPTATSGPVMGPLIHLPMDRQGLEFFMPLSIVVLPGAPNSIVLSMSSGTPNIVVLDDGVARQTAVDMTNVAPSTLVAGPPGFLFGFASMEEDLTLLPITQFGVSMKKYAALIDGGSNAFYMNGRLYVDSGNVLDVSDPLAPSRAGAFAFAGTVAARDAGHVMMVSAEQPTITGPMSLVLRMLDPTEFTQTAFLPVPVTSDDSFPSPRELVYAGGDTAAFVINQSFTSTSLVIVHSPLIATPAPGFHVDPDGGVSTSGPDDGGSPSPACGGCVLTAVPAFGSQMVFDATRHLIYLTADRAATANKNTLVTVDPAQGTVTSALPVGTNPGPIAISDDATTLWLGNTDDKTIQKVALGATQVAGPAYTLPSAQPNSTTPSAAGSLVVLPGTTSAVAAAIAGPAVVILDEGVPRSIIDKDRFAPDSLVIGGGPAGTLFGWSQYEDFTVLSVSASGATQRSFGGLVGGNNLRTMVWLGGAVYGNDGTIIDVSNPDAPVPGGRFDQLGATIAVRGPNRLLMLATILTASQKPELHVLDTSTFRSVAQVTLSDPTLGSIPGLGEMVYVGGDAIAFLVYKEFDLQMYILHADVIGTPP